MREKVCREKKKEQLFAFAAIGPDVWTEAGSGKGKAIEYVITKFYPVIGISDFISYREGYTEGMGGSEVLKRRLDNLQSTKLYVY